MTRPKQKIRFAKQAEAREVKALPYFETSTVRSGQLFAHTKAGVRGFSGIDEAQLLLAITMLKARVSGDILDLTAMGGLLGSLPKAALRAVESSAPALAALKQAGYSAVAAAPPDVLDMWDTKAKTVALVLAGDRGNSYVQAQIAWAHASAPTGGVLYMAGDKDKGFDRYLRLAVGVFGAGEVVARDGGMRVAKIIKRPGQNMPMPEPEEFEYAGIKVIGLAGVFSSSKVDKATAVMLKNLESLDLAGKSVLDIGCGTGIIGAWAASRGAEVTMLEADLQSVRSAKATLQANALAAEVIHSDIDAALEPSKTFDIVITNPPFHVGRGVILDVAREFIAAAKRRLKVGGMLYLVANEPLPYEESMKKIGNTRELARENGFKLLEAIKQ